MTSTPSSTSTRTGASTRSALAAVDPVTAYANDVVAGRAISCRLARKACERHLRDLEHGPARGLRWEPRAARYAIDFFEKFLRHSKGEAAGRSLRLEPWQKFTIGSVFGWKMDPSRFRGPGSERRSGMAWLRRFKTSYKEVPKKNGKSTEAAGLGLIGLVADGEPGAEVYAAATKRDQARIVFGEAREMVRKSPALSRVCNVYKLNISVDRTGSKFEPLSSDTKSADGLNPSTVIIDELHRHKSRSLRNLMDSGTASRRQPLVWIITTAGDDDPQSAYAIEHDYAVKVLEGVIEDDSYFAFITTIDDETKWDDVGELAKANLNLGVSVKLDFLQRLAAKARQSPEDRSDFLRYHCNVRTSDSKRAIDMDLWARNTAGAPIDAAALAGRPCFLSLDLSSKQDISATVKLFPPRGDADRWIVLPRFFSPAETMDKRAARDRAPYRSWCEQGYMEATPGNVIDHGRIRDTIIEDARLYRIEALPYDPWNATQLAIELQNHGLPVVEFIQGLRSYTAPTKRFLDMVIDQDFDHGSNPVLTWMAHNLFVQTDKNENKMPTKAKSTGRIDGITALIMCVGAAIVEEGKPDLAALIESGRAIL